VVINGELYPSVTVLGREVIPGIWKVVQGAKNPVATVLGVGAYLGLGYSAGDGEAYRGMT
jgi:hypothetical protein